VSGLGLSLNIFHGVSLGRAAVLDGIAVTTELTDAATPHAFRVVGFRLSEATDDAAFAEVLRRSDRLRLDGISGAVPSAVIEALLTPTSATRGPGRIRLPSGESWSCPEHRLSWPACARQRDALAAVRALFAEVPEAPAPA
jgi:hypothetical protein